MSFDETALKPSRIQANKAQEASATTRSMSASAAHRLCPTKASYPPSVPEAQLLMRPLSPAWKSGWQLALGYRYETPYFHCPRHCGGHGANHVRRAGWPCWGWHVHHRTIGHG